MNKTALIDTYIARVIMICFILPGALQVMLLVSCTLYFVVRSLHTGYKPVSKHYLWAALLGAGYLLYLIYIPITPQAYRPEALMYCEHRVSYFLFPFALASISPSLIGLIKKELPFFVYATLASALVGNIAFIIHSLSSHSQLLSHVSYRLYFEDITGLHPTYMSLYLGFSICILMFQPVNIRPFYKNILYYLSFLLLFSLFAKTPIAAIFLVIIFLSVSTKGFIKQQKILFLTILLALISVIRFVPFFGQRVGEMVQYANSKDSSSNDVVSNSLYARQLIWEVNKSILKDNWLWGVGPGKVQPMMNVKYYEFYMLTNIAPVYYGPHNEYINAWLAFGLIGVVLLLFTLGLQYYMAFKNKDKLYTSLLILLTIGFITETVLSRQQGVTFYALFTSLFFFLDAKKENQLT